MSRLIKFKKVTAAIASMSLLASAMSPLAASAAGQLTSRSVSLSNPTIGQAAVTQTHTFTTSTSAILTSIDFLTCTTAFGTCTAPTGLTYAGAATSSNPTTVTGTGMGATTNWVKDASSTANDARYTYAANTTSTPSATVVKFAFNGVTNGTTNNTPYYIRITTYNGGTAFSTAVDDGNVVAVPTNALTVSGTVQEQLTFCAYVTTCGTTAVDLGILSSSANTTATSKFDLATNAANGVSVSYIATTFSGPSQTIPAAGAQAHTAVSPTAGTESFALSLTSLGTGVTAANGYGAYAIQTNGSYDQVATAVANGGGTTTVTYAANISTTTKPGVYNSTFNYQAVATF